MHKASFLFEFTHPMFNPELAILPLLGKGDGAELARKNP
jgi:hypothetical protein